MKEKKIINSFNNVKKDIVTITQRISNLEKVLFWKLELEGIPKKNGLLKCKKCGYEWVSTKLIKTGKFPIYCPNCKQAKWRGKYETRC
jgi:predicted Zn-ribbon and HTH transcriptional regulator